MEQTLSGEIDQIIKKPCNLHALDKLDKIDKNLRELGSMLENKVYKKLFMA